MSLNYWQQRFASEWSGDGINMAGENLKKLLLAACAMVATEDPTSGSHLSEILASELSEVCCC